MCLDSSILNVSDKAIVQPYLQYNMLGKSNVTSLSFTVEDDLISQTSMASTQQSAFLSVHPFARQYGLPRPQPPQRILERAQLDAYKQMNQHLFNPFEHKLSGGFIPKQSDLYQQEKARQLQILRKKQEQMVNSNRNYTIVFNERKSGLQTAGRSIVSEGDMGIQDYYKKKFGDKVEGIEEQDGEDGDEKGQQEQGRKKKVDNFIKSVKKVDKGRKEVVSSKEIGIKAVSQTKIQQSSRKSMQPTEGRVVGSAETKKKPAKPTSIKKPTTESNPRPPFVNNPSLKPSDVSKHPPPPIKKPPVSKPTSKPSDQLGHKKYSQIYDGPDRNLVQLLQREVTECPSISFDDIAQLDVAKNLLQEAVLLPRMMPQFFQGIRKAMKGILLFGPPGTGKTLLARAIAKDNVFFNVSASSLASKWKGESEKMVRILFEMAKHYSPSVIFFDEIDCIGSKRSQNEHESARKVKTELLVQMDGVGSSDSEVFVLAATNRPWDLDQALRRRLQKRIYIPLPGPEARLKMFSLNLKQLKQAPNINWQQLVLQTKGYSGADICTLCRDAAMMPMRRKINQIGGIGKIKDIKESDLMEEAISEADLLEACKRVKPSVGGQDLKRYEAWLAEFGST